MVSTAVDVSAAARVLGIKTQFINLRAGRIQFLPQQVAIVAQGSTGVAYALEERQIFSAFEAGQIYGFGSPIHLAALQLLPPNGDGVRSIPVVVYPLEDDGAAAAALGSIEPMGAVTKAGAFRVVINGIPSPAFAVNVGDTIAAIAGAITQAISGELSLPVTAATGATTSDLTSKWKGTSANDIDVVIEGPTDTGITFGITQPTGGTVNPDVQPALDLFGNRWITMVVNPFEYTDDTTLDTVQTHGNGRWGALVRKPYVAVGGATEQDVATLQAAGDARRTDKINVTEVVPDSVELPVAIAARTVARAALTANNNPPVDYGSTPLTGILPGPDASQWSYAQRDALVKAGISTTELVDGEVNMSDTITYYHPEGDPIPAYRYVVDIMKVMNVLYNLNLIFEQPDWDGAPLIPDEQPTVNRAAKKPKMAKAAVNAMIDSLALEAILSDPETAKESTLAVISDQNPKRLDVSLTVQLSGNTNIISIDFNFGFFFGDAPVVA